MGKVTAIKTGLTGFTGFELRGNPVNPVNPVEEKPWPRVKLGEVCAFHRGLTYSKKDEVTFSSNAVLRSNNVDLETGRLKLDDQKYIRDDFEIPSEKLVVKDAILMCMANGSKAHLGKVALIDTEKRFAFGGFMGMLVPNQEVIAGSYLYWVLSSHDFKQLVSSLTDGTNINNLKFSDIDAFELPLPPIAVQHEIVARLEKELAMVERMAKGFEVLKTEADQLFKSTLKETFEEVLRGGAETRRLGDVCEVLDSRRIPIAKSKRIAGSIPYYGATGVVEHVKDFIFDDRLVLLGEDGAKWGPGDNSAFIIEGKSWVNNHAHVLWACDELLDEFLVYHLNNADLGDYITGVTVPKLNQQRMCQIEIPLPPLPTQRKIVAKLDAVRGRCEKLKRTAEEGLQTAALMRKAILKEAFA